MLVYMMVVGITVLPALSNANSLMRNFPQRPICKLEQSCSYYAHPYTFSLCDCPEGRACPDEDEYAIHQDGIRYRFCEPRSIPVCRPQQIATTLNNILTSVHCICPEGLEIVKGPKEPNGTAHFFCGLPQYCNVGEYCGRLDEDAEYIMEECPCPPGTGCVVDPPYLYLFPKTTASCRPEE